MQALSSDHQANHEAFIEQVTATRLVWGLKSDKGWAVCESGEYEDVEVYPFWSDEAYTRGHRADEWASYEPASIDLDLFIETWLTGMDEDNLLVGTNWDSELSGLEVEPSELSRELTGGD